MAHRFAGADEDRALAMRALAQIAFFDRLPMPPEDHDRPLFIPLAGEWFDAFERGQKFDEWRRFGGRWSLKQCRIGREVVLSRGYSGRRLSAVIRSVRTCPAEAGGSATVALFGAETVCIAITLHRIAPLPFAPVRRVADRTR
jgi:hypothetical protein